MNIHLSPMDYYFFRPGLYSMKFLFEFEADIDSNQLQKALRALEFVIPAASGRIQISRDEVILECGGSVPVVEKKLSYEPDLIDECQRNSLVETIRNQEGAPLVHITLTKTPSRMLMGVGFSHLLGDGTSFLHFMHELARATRELPPLQRSYDQRRLFSLKSQQFDDEHLFRYTGYTPNLPADIETEEVRIFYEFSKLEAIRKSARKQGFAVTNNDLIMADLIKTFHQDFADENGVALVRCPVDYRTIGGLKKGYFGNAILDARTTFTQSEAQELSLGEMAAKIRHSIRSIDRDAIERASESLDTFRVHCGVEAFSQLGCPGLVVTNLTKAPLQDLDFGGGPPRCFHPVGMFPRLALIRASPGGEEVILRKPKSADLVVP